MIPFHLVTGFLGSGKTTLLKAVLDQYASRKRIAIIQNEFAASGTDGRELELTGADFKLVEVNNGSVFCVCMLGTFSASVRQVIETYQPELIFLEASGLSDPINIIELLQDPLIRDQVSLSHIFTIVDAVHFERSVRMLTRTRSQVMIADTVLINKSDLLPEGTGAVKELIGEINPFAEVLETSYCRLELDKYILDEEFLHRGATVYGQKTGEGRPDVKAVVLRTNHKITVEGMARLVSELQPFCPRIKGYVNATDGRVYMIQSVFDTFEQRQAENYRGPSEIIAFGTDLTPRMLKDAFDRHAAER